MRALLAVGSISFLLLASCDGGSGADNSGGGGAGGATNSNTSGGGGAATTSGTATSSTTDTSSTSSSTTDTTSTSSTVANTGCETAGTAPVFFANDVQPVFSQSCGSATTCHGKASPSGSLSLKAGESYAALVDVPAKQTCNGQKRVEPGSAAGSYVVNKIEAVDLCPTTKKMPPSTTLPAASKQKIIDWICQGAKND